MSVLRSRVELLQEIDYSHAGIAPERINSFKKGKSEDVRSDNAINKALMESRGSIDYQQIDALIRQVSSALGLERSKYSGGMHDLTPLMVFQAYKEFVDAPRLGAIRMVTTTPSNNFTSFVCGDAADGYAIVLSDLSLTKIVDMLALVPLAFSKVNQRIVTGTEVFESRKITQALIDEQDHRKRITAVAQDFVQFGMFGRSPYGADPTISVDHMRLSATMMEYSTAFLVFHETAHVVLGHLDAEVRAERLQVAGLTEEVASLVSAAASLGLRLDTLASGRSSLEHYARKQLEFEADRFALNVIGRKVNRDHRHPAALTEEFGYLAFTLSLYFLYVGYLEKAQVYLLTGIDPDRSTILDENPGIENLYFRTSHPSPLSRLTVMLEWLTSAEFPGAAGERVDGERVLTYAAQAHRVSSICWNLAKGVIEKILSEGKFDRASGFQGHVGDAELLGDCLRQEMATSCAPP